MAARKPARSGIDARTTLEQFHDHLAPTLDVHEQAVYLFLLRHSRLIGKPKVTIELKTVPRVTAKTCGGKLESLDKKGCIELIEKRPDRAVVRPFLPAEIPGLTGPGEALDDMDFLGNPRNHRLLWEREGRRCFYCLKKLGESNFVVDRVMRHAAADAGYRNAAAICRRCSNRKGESAAEDLLRVLYREGYVSGDDLADRLQALEDLREGRLKPKV